MDISNKGWSDYFLTLDKKVEESESCTQCNRLITDSNPIIYSKQGNECLTCKKETE